MPFLVEPRAYARICGAAQKTERKANGENMVRVVLLIVVVLVLIQLSVSAREARQAAEAAPSRRETFLQFPITGEHFHAQTR